MKCEISNCLLDALVLVIFDDNEKYTLCRKHLEFEDENGIKILKFSAVAIMSLEIPA